MDCIFCKIIDKQIPSQPVYEDENIIILNDLHPQAPIHLLVIPKKHIPEFLDMTQEDLSNVFAGAKEIIQQLGIVDYRLVNNGQGAALIHHFHLHILGKVDSKRNL